MIHSFNVKEKIQEFYNYCDRCVFICDSEVNRTRVRAKILHGEKEIDDFLDKHIFDKITHSTFFRTPIFEFKEIL